MPGTPSVGGQLDAQGQPVQRCGDVQLARAGPVPPGIRRLQEVQDVGVDDERDGRAGPERHTQMTTRRRSSARCSPSVIASAEGRVDAPRNGSRSRVAMVVRGVAGQFMLGSSGTAGSTTTPAYRRRWSTLPRRWTLPRWSTRPRSTTPVVLAPGRPGRPRPSSRRRGGAGPEASVSAVDDGIGGDARLFAQGPLMLVGETVEEGQGRAHGLGHLVGGGQVGKRPPHLALESGPPLPQVVPGGADLARHLRELLGPQNDERDDEDDQQFRRAERQHSAPSLRRRCLPATAADGTAVRAVRGINKCGGR